MPSDSNTSNSFELNRFKNIENSNGAHGYLICHTCYGYYPLKKNELPTDFAECECGNDLAFYENIHDFAKIKSLTNPDVNENNSEVMHDEDEELQEIENVLKSKYEKRKKFFEELSMRIEMQEEILNDFKYDEWRLWDTIEENSLYNNNIKGNKPIVENIIEQEDNFLSYVKEQRSKKINIMNEPHNSHLVETGALLVLLIVIIEIFFLV